MVEFINAFFSYFLLFLVVVVACGIAVFLGISLRKFKNKKAENTEKAAEIINN